MEIVGLRFLSISSAVVRHLVQKATPDINLVRFIINHWLKSTFLRF